MMVGKCGQGTEAQIWQADGYVPMERAQAGGVGRKVIALAAMGLGMVTLGLTGCGGESAPTEPAAPRFSVADGTTRGAGSEAGRSPSDRTATGNISGRTEASQEPVSGPPPVVASAALEALTVPSGADAVTLEKFLASVDQQEQTLQQAAPSMAPEALQSRFLEIQKARLDAASRMLSIEGATPTQRQAAFDRAMMAFNRAGALPGGTAFASQLTAFIEQYINDSDPRVAQFANLFRLNIHAAQSLAVADDGREAPPSGATPPSAVVTEAKQLLPTLPQDNDTIQMSLQAASTLINGQQYADGLALLQVIRDQFAASRPAEMPTKPLAEMTAEERTAAARYQLLEVVDRQIESARVQQVLAQMGLEQAIEASQSDPAAAGEVVRIYSEAMTRDDLPAFPLLAGGVMVADILDNLDHVEPAVTLAKRLTEKFGDLTAADSQEQLARASALIERNNRQSSLRQAMMDINLEERMQALEAGQEGAGADLVQAVDSVMGRPDLPKDGVINVSLRLAEQLEQVGFYEPSRQLYQQIASRFGQPNEDAGLSKPLADQARQTAEMGLKRVGLIGKPLPIDGTVVGGGKFNADEYRGKVVLVDFWATWCGPCLAEIPNIKTNYEKYKSRGFEVIGLNIDDDVATVEGFLERQPLPWKTVIANDPDDRGPQWPLVQNSGIIGIPFVVLIDQEGRVVRLHVRGERLAEELEKRLGS